MLYHRTNVYAHVKRTGVSCERTWEGFVREKKNDFVNGIY